MKLSIKAVVVTITVKVNVVSLLKGDHSFQFTWYQADTISYAIKHRLATND